MKTHCELSHKILAILGCQDIAYEPRPAMEQLFYSITQVSKIVGVQPHVIRYWEKHFSVLNPGRGSSSNWRNYVAADIELLKRIKVLINDKGMTINGAKKLLYKNNSAVSVVDELEGILTEIDTVC